jgi:nucleotide-binding universal stress UspA family protein
MSKVLIPLDGSANADRALSQWLSGQTDKTALDVHLLSVQLPVDGNVRTFVDSDELQDYRREEGMSAMAQGRKLLDDAGVAYQHHILVGHPADVIVRYASELGVDEIVMGTHGRTGLLQLLMGSVASEVSEKAKAKVTLIK